MNYKLHYEKLISKAQNRSILKSEYKENHHIIPSCMDGSDDESNLVLLFPEEHALAHLLLVKIYPYNLSLIQAANIMLHGGNNTQNRIKITTKTYKWLREKHSMLISEKYKGVNNPNSKEYILISPKNKIFNLGIDETLVDFSKRYNLNIGDLSSVANNKLTHSKFWLCFYKEEFNDFNYNTKIKDRDRAILNYNLSAYIVSVNGKETVFNSKKEVMSKFNLSTRTVEMLSSNNDYIPKILSQRNIVLTQKIKIKKIIPESLMMV